MCASLCTQDWTLIIFVVEICLKIVQTYSSMAQSQCKFVHPNCKLQIATQCIFLQFVPAVNDNRSGVWNGTLGAVDFL